MDPLDVIGNLHNVKPVYQPIISAIRQDVKGHEVLGRYHDGEAWQSLRSFFMHPDVPEEFKVEVDQHLLTVALEKVMAEGVGGLLFINRSAKELMVNDGEDLLDTLLEFEEKGFDLSRIVIEVREHDFDEDFEALNHLLLYYKTFGIMIAVDHVGAKSSNIDRIRQLEPHILKVDTMHIRNHDSQGFQDIMYSLSMLANRIGAAMLFETIEDDYQLYFAWKHGGRYYQGFYLAEPSFEFATKDSLRVDAVEKVNQYIRREKALVERRLRFVLSWEQRLKERVLKWEGPKKVDQYLERLTSEFNEESFRMFICDADGIQVSSNFRKRQEEWEPEYNKKGSNWAFRPYFLENVMQMKTWNKGLLSDIYSDIETKELIRTFSFPLTDQYFLFIDLNYSYIYENEFLLM
ncbi:EAL domain-containing protein [Halobacillus litoralis]|uniref:EAL domain-containing protein n=1 Tax=Halobacillus litoralis TaxID=45668 RepID=UPI001CD55AB4|nr:EAL domain-containing protein [Halobacillus litoralis]MCA0970237.1 EAL domain-containing protein [Halobacillus litoralis]